MIDDNTSPCNMTLIQKSIKTYLALTMLFSVMAFPVLATDTREHEHHTHKYSVHVHGTAELTMVLEGSRL